MVKIKLGDRAPDFTLQSSTGENISLSQFLGKKNVFLFFYPRDTEHDRGCLRNPYVCSR
jgi:thioredoxin-dependent peroxiredoxin